MSPNGDLPPEKTTNCDGATGPSAMRRLVLGRGSEPARDLLPDEDALREWVSRAGPEKEAWEHETGRVALEQGLVVLAWRCGGWVR